MNNDLYLEARTAPVLLQAVRGLVRGYIAGAGIVDERADEIVLAVDEACTNCIRHAYGSEENRRYTLECRSDRTGLEIEIRDYGTPMPAAALNEEEDAAPDPESLKPGGLGVQLMRRVFDDVSFSSGTDGGNRVIMRLNREPAAEEG
jgi:anti-sigma regulatory factor (Ser/Thr protein kinase)